MFLVKVLGLAGVQGRTSSGHLGHVSWLSRWWRKWKRLQRACPSSGRVSGTPREARSRAPLARRPSFTTQKRTGMGMSPCAVTSVQSSSSATSEARPQISSLAPCAACRRNFFACFTVLGEEAGLNAATFGPDMRSTGPPAHQWKLAGGTRVWG